MGLSCASLHFPGSNNLDQIVQALAERLRCDRVESGDLADRALAAVQTPPWISIFDLSNPDGVTDELTDLGKQLSAVSEGPVLLTAVWDSDVFGFILYENGSQIDGYASGRGLLPGRIKRMTPDKRAVEWSRAFNRSFSPDVLESVMKKGHLFAEDQLAKIAELLGFPAQVATSTSKDLKSGQWQNQARYYFRSPALPGGTLHITQTLACKGATLPMQIVVRQERFGSFELNSPAAGFVDPVFEFAGSPIDSGFVNLVAAHAFWSLGIDHIRAGGAVRFDADITAVETDGKRVVRAVLKDLSAQKRSFPPRKKSILSFLFDLRGVAPGSGEMQVSCRPNPQ